MPLYMVLKLYNACLRHNFGDGWVNEYAGNLRLWKYKSFGLIQILLLYVNGKVHCGEIVLEVKTTHFLANNITC